MGLAGVPLPFYKSDTLLLSLGLSWRVWAMARPPSLTPPPLSESPPSQLRDWKPDVIHTACPGLLVFAAKLYCVALRAPLVLSYHTHIPEYIKSYTWRGLAQPMWALIRAWTSSADVMLCTSSVMVSELARNACRPRRLALWRRGVDVDVFSPTFASAEARATLAGGAQHAASPLLLYVGRLGAEKNLLVLKDVLAANPGARLALVGDGPQRAVLEAHFAARLSFHSLHTRCSTDSRAALQGTPTVFTGLLSGVALSAAFASADVFVMPSETETLGFVVLEAMASGVPVVAVAAGGIPDIVSTPGVTGLLFPAGDVAAASSAVASLIADPEKRAAIGAAGRADVSRWGWPAASRHLRETLYSRAIAHAAAAHRFRRAARAAAARLAVFSTAQRLFASHGVLHGASVLAGATLFALVSLALPSTFSPAALASHAVSSTSAAAFSLSSAWATLLWPPRFALAALLAAGGALPLVPLQPLAFVAGLSFGLLPGFCVAWAGVVGAAACALATARATPSGRHLAANWIPLGAARPFLRYQLARVAAAAAPAETATLNAAAASDAAAASHARASVRSWVPQPVRVALAVALLRLRPLAPFSLSNYALAETPGLTSAPFLFGTALGMLPWCAVYAAAGAAWRAKSEAGRRLAGLAGAAGGDALRGGLGPLLAAAALLALAAALIAAHRHEEAAAREQSRAA